MIKPEQIPDEVIDTVCDGSTDELFKQGMRWMIAAAINAWPGRVVHQDVKKDTPEFFQIGVYLPTPSEWQQEKNTDPTGLTLVDMVTPEVWNHDASKDNCCAGKPRREKNDD